MTCSDRKLLKIRCLYTANSRRQQQAHPKPKPFNLDARFHGVFHIADWYATLCNLAGVDHADYAAADAWGSYEHSLNWGVSTCYRLERPV